MVSVDYTDTVVDSLIAFDGAYACCTPDRAVSITRDGTGVQVFKPNPDGSMTVPPRVDLSASVNDSDPNEYIRYLRHITDRVFIAVSGSNNRFWMLIVDDDLSVRVTYSSGIAAQSGIAVVGSDPDTGLMTVWRIENIDTTPTYASYDYLVGADGSVVQTGSNGWGSNAGILHNEGGLVIPLSRNLQYVRIYPNRISAAVFDAANPYAPYREVPVSSPMATAAIGSAPYDISNYGDSLDGSDVSNPHYGVVGAWDYSLPGWLWLMRADPGGITEVSQASIESIVGVRGSKLWVARITGEDAGAGTVATVSTPDGAMHCLYDAFGPAPVVLDAPPNGSGSQQSQIIPTPHGWWIRYNGNTIRQYIVSGSSAGPAVRMYPREDGLGLSSGRRTYPPPRSRRTVGGIL